MRVLILPIAVTLLLSCSKKKNKDEVLDCFGFPALPPPAYAFPRWHPNGELFSFNHIPVIGFEQSPCLGLIYKLRYDSAGFYTLHKNGTRLAKVMEYNKWNCSWSLDGSKLMYKDPLGIFAIPFNGNAFDTAARQKINAEPGSEYLFLNEKGDSVYYQTSVPATTGHRMLKVMTLDGSGRKDIRSAEYHDISLASNNRFYYLNGNREIWSMDQNGQDIKQELANAVASYENRSLPKYYDGNIYYMNVRKLMRAGNGTVLLADNIMDFSISSKGEIIYSLFENKITESNKQNGVFWIMNADGSNKRQLTFNNF